MTMSIKAILCDTSVNIMKSAALSAHPDNESLTSHMKSKGSIGKENHGNGISVRNYGANQVICTLINIKFIFIFYFLFYLEHLDMSAEQELQTYKNQFNVELDGIKFLKTYYDPSDKPTYEINTQHMNDAIDVLKRRSVHGGRVLEIGCGPNIMNSLVTCSFFDEIYLSDFNFGMLKPLEDWVKGNVVGFDNSYMVNYVAKKMNISPNELEKQTRLKIKKVLRSDIHLEQPVQSGNNFFDGIITRFCVDSCSPNLPSYNKAIKNITNCLKNEGYFLQMGFFDHDSERHTKGYWDIGSLRVEDLRLTKSQVRLAVEDAGMKIVEWKERIHQQSTECDFKNTSSYTLLAQKVK